LKNIVEALLFATPEPLTQAKLNQVMDGGDVDLQEIVEQLNEEYSDAGKALYIGKVAGGFQILTHPDYHLYIQRLFTKSHRLKLSSAALEALAIIAYKQPISKMEVESIRGVGCDSVIRSLLERELITIKGRDEGIGRALLYGTTQEFLKAFGLNDISDLPKLKELNQLVMNSSDNRETPNETE